MLKRILKKIRRLEIAAKNKIDSQFSGNYRSAFRGRGIEFADIRPYDTGDDVRDIDWKTTSKQGEIYVKTYHETRDNTIFFVIDMTEVMQFTSIQEKKYERLLEAFALLAFAAIQNGDRVGVLFYGHKEEKIFPPKKGRRNVLKILKYAIEKYQNTTQKNISPPVAVELVFQKVFRFLRHSSSIFWCTGEIPELSQNLQKSLKICRTKHELIPLVFTDPLEVDFTEKGDFTFQDIFSGKMKSISITPEVAQNFRKIRVIKQKKFQKFFQTLKSTPIFFQFGDRIFSKFFVFFQQKRRL